MKAIWRWMRVRKCRRKGHDWFPGGGPNEFITHMDLCFRCGAKRVTLPWGMCLGDQGPHPIAEHYDAEGHGVPLQKCVGPR